MILPHGENQFFGYYRVFSGTSKEISSWEFCIRPFILAVSYNRPKLSRNARWETNGSTVLTYTQIGYTVGSIFINKNNTLYIAPSSSGSILSFVAGNLSRVKNSASGAGLFVTGNGDLYSSSSNQVDKWSVNATSSLSVMRIFGTCYDIFVDINNTLYCSLNNMNQVLAKQVDDSSNSLRIAAGTGCSGASSSTLYRPSGIFVSLNFSLYVADTENARIQHFTPGSKNATTVAGIGAPGTINLDCPADIVLDGNGYLFIIDSGDNLVIGSGPDGFRCVAGCASGGGSCYSFPHSQMLNLRYSMSFDSHGNIWVADDDKNRIWMFALKPNSSGKHDLFSNNEGRLHRSIECTTFFVPVIHRSLISQMTPQLQRIVIDR